MTFDTTSNKKLGRDAASELDRETITGLKNLIFLKYCFRRQFLTFQPKTALAARSMNGECFFMKTTLTIVIAIQLKNLE